jgi:cyanate permease
VETLLRPATALLTRLSYAKRIILVAAMPLLMGALYGRSGSYAVGLALLAAVAAGALVLASTAVRKSARPVAGTLRGA